MDGLCGLSVAEHNTQLFLLLLEECRSGMSTQISKQPQGYLSGSSAGSGGGGGTKSQQVLSSSTCTHSPTHTFLSLYMHTYENAIQYHLWT